MIGQLVGLLKTVKHPKLLLYFAFDAQVSGLLFYFSVISKAP